MSRASRQDFIRTAVALEELLGAKLDASATKEELAAAIHETLEVLAPFGRFRDFAPSVERDWKSGAVKADELGGAAIETQVAVRVENFDFVESEPFEYSPGVTVTRYADHPAVLLGVSLDSLQICDRDGSTYEIDGLLGLELWVPPGFPALLAQAFKLAAEEAAKNAAEEAAEAPV